MQLLHDFVKRILKELHFEDVGPTMQKSLELKIGEIVDKEIENALAYALTDDDWKVYDDYLKNHPGAKAEDAMNAMLNHREGLKRVLEDTMATTYDDIVLRGDIAQMVAHEHEVKSSK